MQKEYPVSLSVLSVLFIVIITSCVSTETSLFNTMKIRATHYESKNFAVILDYPEDWFVKEEDELLFSSVSSFDIAANGGAGLAILKLKEEDVQKEFETSSLDKVIELFVNELHAEFNEIEDAMIDGVKSRQVEFIVLQEKEIKGEIIIYNLRQYIYIFLTAVHPPELFNKYKQIFTAMIDSIKFIRESY